MRKKTYAVRGAELHLPRVIRYKSAAALVRAAQRFDGAQFDHYTHDALVTQVESDGLWGFAMCRPRLRQIHYWAGPRATPTDLIEFFAHEIGHLVHDGAKLVKGLEGGLPKEERRAEVYAAVAGLALRLAQRAASSQ